MDNSKILDLIKSKELEIKKLQLEVVELNKQLNQQPTNEKENASNREESVNTFMNYFKGRDDTYPYTYL